MKGILIAIKQPINHSAYDCKATAVSVLALTVFPWFCSPITPFSAKVQTRSRFIEVEFKWNTISYVI